MKSSIQKTLTHIVLASCTAAAMFSLPMTASADSSVYQNALNSTVWVLAKKSGETSSGTGVLVDSERKLVVTNFHVVGDSRNAVIFFPEVTDGAPIVSRQHYLKNVKRLGTRGSVIAIDRKRDLALIELDKLPENAQAIELAEESIGPGSDVQSIGNPGSTEALWVFTSGTVRAVYQKKFRTGAGEHDFKVVETQSPINSGDSGGPVMNDEGKLVAISQAIAPKARLVTYSVDVSEVKEFMASPWKPSPLPAAEVLTTAELEYTKHETGFLQVDFNLEKEEKQSVFITNEIEYFQRADVRKIWSLALATKQAPNVDTMMKLLVQSSRTKIGAWTVEQTKEGDYLILYVVKMDATATPAAVKSTMDYVAKLAGLMKKELAPQQKAQDASETLDDWLGK